MNPTPVPSPDEETALSVPGRPVTVEGRAAGPNEETALSAHGHTAGSRVGESTAGGPSDLTVVRGTSSDPTVNDQPAPNNFGRYELLGEIARGGMGVVYRARQHGLDRTVALKMILGTGINHETAQRFLQEARAAAALDHPNVVPIYDIDEIGDRPYFTMALIDGPNLRGHVDALGTVPIPVAVALFAQVVAGVAHAHQHGIIHRDLKPANVLIDKDGRPRVTDFGLAKRSTTDSQLTVTGQVVGTPQYMAPEQARDSKDVGPPADVYALGAILYFLLTGHPPFGGESITDVLIKVVTEAPVPPGQLRPDVPADVEELCLRCLAKKPEERFADASALAEALAPITDRYVPASGFTPSLSRAALSAASTPKVGTVPDLTPTTNSVPALASAAPAVAPAPAAPSEPAPNRSPMFIGLAAAAVVLVGATVFLATRGTKKDEVAKQEPPAPAPVVSAPGARSADPTPAVVYPAVPDTVAPTGADADRTALPVALTTDFGLKVELEAPGAKRDANGVLLLTADTPLKIRLKADKDCRVMVWFVDPAGHAKERLFPNDDDSDDRLAAGKERTVPGNDGYTLETTVTEGTGLDRLRVFATTGRLPAFPPGSKAGRFVAYTGPESEQLASTIRGVTKKKAAGAAPAAEVAEAEIRFRVEK